MQVASTISPRFIEGFVEQCMQMGLNADETESLFQKHAHNALVARPDIYDGFRSVVGSYEGPLTKSAVARWMSPDMIALNEEIRLAYGDDPLSCQLRDQFGMPEPSWDTVPDHIKEAAAGLSDAMGQFDYLPLNQKILLAALAGGGIGGGLGGISRGLNPSDEDEEQGRGVLNRVSRGAVKGTGIGAGLGAGAGALAHLVRGR